MRLIKYILSVTAPLVLSIFPALGQPDPIYANFGTVNDAPQINATAFYNSGNFDVGGISFAGIGGLTFVVNTTIPYQTLNTLYWTNANSGIMDAGTGYLFDYATPTFRYPSDTFVNRGDIFGGTHLIVNSTNVISSGFLSTTREGLIRLDGQNVNLTRGGMQVSEFSRGGSFPPGNEGNTNYSNTVGVDDVYGGVGTNGVIDAGQGGGGGNPLDVSGFIPPGPSSGPHQVVTAGGFTNNTVVPLGFAEFTGYMNTNMVDDTNTVVQMVFVNEDNPDTNFNVQVKFVPSNNPAQTVIVEFSLTDTNIVTGDPITNLVYFIDRSATLARTNLILKENTSGAGFKPNGYQILRSTPNEWFSAVDPNTEFEEAFVNGPDFPNTIVTNIYLGYSATIDANQAAAAAGGGGFFFGGAEDPYDGFSKINAINDPTNQAGRITIDADTLNLSGTRLRASGIVDITAEDYVGAPPFGIDTSLLTLELKSVSGEGLHIENIVKDTVSRLSGRINAWTGIWTNFMQVVTDDTSVDPPVSTTNQIAFQYNVLMVQGNFQTIIPVQVRDLNLYGDNVEIVDNLRVNREFLIDSPNVTVSGGFLGIPEDVLGVNQMPSTINLTNSGSISLNNKVILGSDRAMPYENIVNSGFISAGTLDISTQFLRNEGVLDTGTGGIFVEAETTEIDGGVIESMGNVLFRTTDFLGRNSTFLVGTNSGPPQAGFATLIFDVPGQLEDAGVDAGNLWQFSDGIQVLQRPAGGDLLGTTLLSLGTRFQEILHLWPAENRGNSTEGYNNNLAVGTLVLDGDAFSLFTFQGTGEDNAMYVDTLQFDNFATNWMDSVNIADNMTLYFADAVNVDPSELDGAFDGKLVWVSDFVGPEPSEEQAVEQNSTDGVTISLSRASADGSGGGDSGGITLNSESGDSDNLLSFEAAPGATYEIQSTNDIENGPWVTVEEVTNTSETVQTVTFADVIPEGEKYRFYRIVQK